MDDHMEFWHSFDNEIIKSDSDLARLITMDDNNHAPSHQKVPSDNRKPLTCSSTNNRPNFVKVKEENQCVSFVDFPSALLPVAHETVVENSVGRYPCSISVNDDLAGGRGVVGIVSQDDEMGEFSQNSQPVAVKEELSRAHDKDGDSPLSKRMRTTSNNPTASMEEQRQRQLNHRRARNRKHAKETRRRKKEAVDAMEHELAALRKEQMLWRENHRESSSGGVNGVGTPDACHGGVGVGGELLLEKSEKLKRQQRWCHTTHALLRLQSHGELNEALWEEHMDPRVVLVHPLTPYRSYLLPTRQSKHCVLLGIPALVKDMIGFVVAVGALCRRGLHREGSLTRDRQDGGNIIFGQQEADPSITASQPHLPCDVKIAHLCDQDGHFYFNETGLMCRFQLQSLNLVQHGLQSEVSERGSLQVTFNECDKIVRIEYVFDAVSCWRQIQHSLGSPEMVLTPNFLASALRDSAEARLVLSSKVEPFTVTHANAAWCALMGYSEDEVRGASLQLFKGEYTSVPVMAAFEKDCQCRRPSSMNVTLYRKDCTGLPLFVQLCPLTDEEDLSGVGAIHLLLIMSLSHPSCSRSCLPDLVKPDQI